MTENKKTKFIINLNDPTIDEKSNNNSNVESLVSTDNVSENTNKENKINLEENKAISNSSRKVIKKNPFTINIDVIEKEVEDNKQNNDIDVVIKTDDKQVSKIDNDKKEKKDIPKINVLNLAKN